MPTHIDLFAGIGGFSLGFENAGIDTLAHVEIDEKCKGVLRNHWGDHLIFSDVCEVGKHNLPYADIITFGSPCQDLSIAGKRKGFADGTRSNLFFEAVRIIREIEPRYAVWENVPGALSSHDGRDFQSVIESLLDTDIPMPKSGRWASSGMVRTGQKEVAWRILDAQYFGVAQRRRRVFLIYCAGNGSPSSILFERECVRRNHPPRGKTGQGIARETSFSLTFCDSNGTRKDRPNGGIYVNETNKSNTLAGVGKGGVLMTKTVSGNDYFPTILSNSSKQWTGNQEAFSGDYFILEGDGSPHATLNKNISPTMSRRHADHVLFEDIAATSRTLRQGKDGGGKGYLGSEELGMTLGGQQQFVGVRRLTPTECERLQGFPDGWTAGQADSTRYKQLGNAVAVPVAEWIGRRVMQL